MISFLRRSILCAVAFISTTSLCLASAEADTTRLARLDSLLGYYAMSMERESLETKYRECDYLISSVVDSTLVNHIALWLFDHYKESKLMGEEAVAIYVFDNYFKNGPLKMRTSYEKLEAEMFASFNRETLLGKKAPSVSLRNPGGRYVTLPADGSISVLFFYDTECSKCKLESGLIPSVMAAADFPCTFFAVYCGDNQKSWAKFRRKFRIRNRKVELVHLWDPVMETEYLRQYGVISTPRMYVTLQDGEVIGRRLEVESLQEIINLINISYGKEKTTQGSVR